MEKNDTIVTDMVIQALKMDDTIKRQEVIIEQLKSDKNELLVVIARMKELLYKLSPESVKQLEMFNLWASKQVYYFDFQNCTNAFLSKVFIIRSAGIWQSSATLMALLIL